MNLFESIIKKAVIKRLSNPGTLRAIIKHASSQATSLLLTWIATSPEIVQNAIQAFNERSSIDINEASMSVIIGFLIAEVAQYFVDKINYEGTEKIQEGLNEVKDGWIGDDTIKAFNDMRSRLGTYASELDKIRKELASYKVKNLPGNQK